MSTPRAAAGTLVPATGTGFRMKLGVQATLLLPNSEQYGLELDFFYGNGPAIVELGPQTDPRPKPLSLGQMVTQIAHMLEVEDLAAVTSLTASEPWNHVFAVQVAPHLTVQLSNNPSVQLVVDLFVGGEPGIELPGNWMPSWLKIEPDFTVYSLIVGYDSGGKGLDVSARVTFKNQKTALTAGTDPPAKTEIVSVPFPTPPPSTPNLEIKYLGLGQRFGPTVDIHAADPLAAMFEELEKQFTTNDPKTLLETLAKKYYDPKRDWFVGAHVLVRGWEIRAVFNDPALYGLEVECTVDTFKGLLLEILYQKLGDGLGVYYGALTLPTQYRTIQLGAAALTLPSFRIWIYTNGDFKVSVGWPLGANSIGLQIYIFTGGCGFYFAKLRSGDNPDSGPKALLERGSEAVGQDVGPFNPILEFGLGAWFGLGRSISSGPFSASLSLTVQGTFQGILAWDAPPAPQPGGSPPASSISRSPDYYWFAATVSLIGELQGAVDLKIIKLSIFVRLSVTAGIALETDYASQVTVTASVDVEASLTIVFIKISVGFHTTITQTFQISGGMSPPASLDGPHNPAFAGMNDWAATGLDALEERMLERRAAVAHAATAPAPRALPAAPGAAASVDLRFLLQPSAVYDSQGAVASGIAGLTIGCPPPGGGKAGDPETDLQKLAAALGSWLLRTYAPDGHWTTVVTALGQGREDPPAGWQAALDGFLENEVSFTLGPTDLTDTATADAHVAFFPMFDELELSWTGGGPVVFAKTGQTYPNYVEVVDEYFAELSLGGLTSNPPELRSAPATAGTPPDPPTGPSLARLVFDDYFLTLARQLAREMTEATDLTPKIVANLGGIASRYLLGGLRLPDPATTPATGPIDFADLTIDAGYALTGQQFPLDTTKTTCDATLQIGSGSSDVADWIHFAGGGTSVTSSMPVAPLPPSPDPVWTGLGVAGASTSGATIAIEAIPAAHAHDRIVTVRTRLPWQQPGGAIPFLVPLPTDVLTSARDEPLTVTVTEYAPPEQKDSKQVPVEPVLLIPITVHLVDRSRDTNVAVTPPAGGAGGAPPTGTTKSPYAPFVYRIDGTDDETRDRIEAALAGAKFDGSVTLALLYDAPKTGYVSDALDQQAHPVVLAKTNLSTTSQPGSVTTPMRLVQPAVDGDLGPSAATPADVEDFLRIVWEVSVVRSGGFFLRYQDADGKGLPDSIFSSPDHPAVDGIPSGDTAQLTLAVSFGGATQFQRWHNAFAVTLDKGYDKALYLGLAHSAGAIQDLSPSYPPGCVAFSAQWSLDHLLRAASIELYDADWVAHLYHLIQFQVSGESAGSSPAFDTSLWSLALTPQGDDEAGTSTYRQVVPAYKFVHGGGPSPNPYAAVGGKPVLTLRLNDVYGNALEADTHDAAFDVLYSDALMTPAEWPGVRIAYRFVPVPDGAPKGTQPTLTLKLEFEPDEVIRAATPAMMVHGLLPEETTVDDHRVQQARVALQRYAIAIAQLADSRTTVSLTASVLPSFDAGGALAPLLVTFAQASAAELQKVVDGSGTPQPVTTPVALTIDPADLAKASDDILAVEVTLGVARPRVLVYADAKGRRVPGSDATELAIPPDLDPPVSGTTRAVARAAATGDDVKVDVGLTEFAADFESVFAGFDGAGSAARLAVRSDTPDFSAPSTTFLWALRWSAGAGIHVGFPSDPHEPIHEAAYFSLEPLAVNLEGGVASVPAYDAQLHATYADRTFAGIDLDAWAQTFLQAVDRVLAPDVATVVAAVDPTTYANLMLAKSVLAEALGKSVASVYDPNAAGVLAGDLAGAQDHLEQAALTGLSAAYSIASVVQVPTVIHTTGSAGPLAPRLFGAVGVPEDATDPDATGVTVSSAKLEIAPSTVAAPAFLNFFVSVSDASVVANAELELEWRVRFSEHMTAGVEEYGYQPSEWLRIVREVKDDPLSFEIGTLAAPIPVRQYPAAPVLHDQTATQSKPAGGASTQGADPLAPYMRWDYGVGLTLPEELPQDALWLDVTYNAPVASATQKLAVDVPTLFQTLAAFNVAWPVLESYVRGLADGGGAPVDGVDAKAIVAAVWTRVQPVARAWARLRGIPDPWGDEVGSARAKVDAPAQVVDSYMIDFAHAYDRKQLSVYARAQSKEDGGGCRSDALAWPTINGKSPDAGSIAAVCNPPDSTCAAAPSAEPCWFHATYPFEPPTKGQPGDLALVWPRLDVLERQTARTGCWVSRNAQLSGAQSIPTNPAFVYSTPEVSFASAVMPAIVATGIGPLPPEATFAATLEAALSDLAQAGSAASSRRLVKVALTYGYDVGAVGGVRAETAILLADELDLRADGQNGSGDGSFSLADLCKALDADCHVWFQYYAPVTTGATVSVALFLFADVAGSRLPIIQIDDLQLSVSDSWWPRAAGALR